MLRNRIRITYPVRFSHKVTQLLEGRLIGKFIQQENDKVARLASGS
jgi:hypothetical protein